MPRRAALGRATAITAYLCLCAFAASAYGSVGEARGFFEQYQQASERARETGQELAEAQAAAAQAQREGDASGYRGAAQQLQRLSPELNRQGQVARHALREAVRLYADAGAMETDDPGLLIEYAAALREKGDLDLVEKALARAADLRPNDPALWLDLGRVRVETGPAVGGPAHPALRRALDLAEDPGQRADAYALLGDAFLEADLTDPAGRAYRKGLEELEAHQACRRGLARMLIRQGRMAAAVELVTRLEQEAASAGEGRQAFESLRTAVGNALSVFAQSGRVFPDEAREHGAYGQLLARAGLFQEARSALLRAQELEPDFPGAGVTLRQIEGILER